MQATCYSDTLVSHAVTSQKTSFFSLEVFCHSLKIILFIIKRVNRYLFYICRLRNTLYVVVKEGEKNVGIKLNFILTFLKTSGYVGGGK